MSSVLLKNRKKHSMRKALEGGGNDMKYVSEIQIYFHSMSEKHQKNNFLARTHGTIVWKKMLNVQILC